MACGWQGRGGWPAILMVVFGKESNKTGREGERRGSQFVWIYRGWRRAWVSQRRKQCGARFGRERYLFL